MKLIKTENFLKMENPTPGEIYRKEILTGEDHANDLGGIVGLAPPKFEGPIHYHEKRESIIMVLRDSSLYTFDPL